MPVHLFTLQRLPFIHRDFFQKQTAFFQEKLQICATQPLTPSMLYYLFEYLDKRFDFPGAGVFQVLHEGVVAGQDVLQRCVTGQRFAYEDDEEQPGVEAAEGLLDQLLASVDAV